MKLAVSNMAWDGPSDREILWLLRRKGVTGIEVALTKVWPDWDGATVAAANTFRTCLADEGFTIPALQAIVYGRTELSLFESEERRRAFIDHVRYVADLAGALGARVMVYGAPSSRDRGKLDKRSAFSIAIDVFRRVGEQCAARGTCLCIEPNPARYGCNFVTTSAEGVDLVEAVGSEGFGIHLDAAAMTLAGEDSAEAIQRSVHLMRHFHVSEPDLADFDKPQVDHLAVANGLRKAGYARWISIEMRRTCHAQNALIRALDYVQGVYGPVIHS